jgi:small subunit ribosomal protein S2
MASLVKSLVEAGIHFGHRASHWNPKMGPYIYGKRNKIHILDVKETVKGLLRARKYLTRTVSNGGDVLFVGTKRQARDIVQRHAEDCGMHYITQRWLGGTLTNFRTIRERLKRLEELERIEASGELNSYSKKMEAQLNREKHKIHLNLGGLRNMNKLPAAMVVVDVWHEHNAVREARKLGIPTVALIDTDSDPDFADIPIPGNDDAMRAIEVVLGNLVAAVQEGKQHRQPAKGQAESAEQGGEPAQSEQEAEGGEGETLSQRRRRQRQSEVEYSADSDSAHAGVGAEGDPAASPPDHRAGAGGDVPPTPDTPKAPATEEAGVGAEGHQPVTSGATYGAHSDNSEQQ